jgi:hypothetical protein
MTTTVGVREHDKSTWGPGPWQSEPDRVDFEAHGFACMILRGPVGALCGYLGVPKGHPWYENTEVEPEGAHGGITYRNKCQGHICHVPKPGMSDDVYWLGFDCAHCDDYMPSNEFLRTFGTYKTIGYVHDCVEAMAVEAKAVATEGG